MSITERFQSFLLGGRLYERLKGENSSTFLIMSGVSSLKRLNFFRLKRLGAGMLSKGWFSRFIGFFKGASFKSFPSDKSNLQGSGWGALVLLGAFSVILSGSKIEPTLNSSFQSLFGRLNRPSVSTHNVNINSVQPGVVAGKLGIVSLDSKSSSSCKAVRQVLGRLSALGSKSLILISSPSITALGCDFSEEKGVSSMALSHTEIDLFRGHVDRFTFAGDNSSHGLSIPIDFSNGLNAFPVFSSRELSEHPLLSSLVSHYTMLLVPFELTKEGMFSTPISEPGQMNLGELVGLVLTTSSSLKTAPLWIEISVLGLLLLVGFGLVYLRSSQVSVLLGLQVAGLLSVLVGVALFNLLLPWSELAIGGAVFAAGYAVVIALREQQRAQRLETQFKLTKPDGREGVASQLKGVLSGGFGRCEFVVYSYRPVLRKFVPVDGLSEGELMGEVDFSSQKILRAIAEGRAVSCDESEEVHGLSELYPRFFVPIFNLGRLVGAVVLKLSGNLALLASDSERLLEFVKPELERLVLLGLGYECYPSTFVEGEEQPLRQMVEGSSQPLSYVSVADWRFVANRSMRTLFDTIGSQPEDMLSLLRDVCGLDRRETSVFIGRLMSGERLAVELDSKSSRITLMFRTSRSDHVQSNDLERGLIYCEGSSEVLDPISRRLGA